MARFRGEVQGNRGYTSRLGSPSSGLVTHANGWHGGIDVYLWVDKDGNDCYRVTLTPGSGFSGSCHTLAEGLLDAVEYEKRPVPYYRDGKLHLYHDDLCDEEETCSTCKHPSASHFGKEGYGCDDCPESECVMEPRRIEV